MKLQVLAIPFLAFCASSASVAQQHPALPSAHHQIFEPSPPQMGFSTSPNFPCFRSFDLGVRAIRAGFAQDGVRCLDLAAKAGDVRAQRAIGLMLQNGVLLPRSPDAAAGWFYEAALRGDAQSMYLLGKAFEEGQGVDRDSRLGAYWLNRAAEEGYTSPAP